MTSNGRMYLIRVWTCCSLVSVVSLVESFSSLTGSHHQPLKPSSQPTCCFTLSSAFFDVPPSSTCPYTRAYARHRIDLTTPKRNNNKDKENILAKRFSSLFFKLFDNPQQRLQRARQVFGPDACIVVLEIDEIDQSQTESKTSCLLNVATMTALWKAAASLDELAENASATEETIIWILASHVSVIVVQNWVEIYSWWLLQFGSGNDRAVEFVLVDGSIPCVRITTSLRDRSRRQEQQVITEHASATTIDDTAIHQATRHWVKRILVEQQICPFTKSTKYSGQGLADLHIPVAKIDYVASQSSSLPALMADAWTAIFNMLQAGPMETSSILLAAPAWNHDFAAWAGPVFAVLEASVVAAQAESQLGVVCFHPRYQVSDGSIFCGFGQMHSLPRLEQWVRQQPDDNPRQSSQKLQEEPEQPIDLTSSDIAAGGAFQRRTPHATINVLRADQLQVAENKRSSPELYKRNIECLHEIGWEKLQQNLDLEQNLR